jgi:hypothetical protein
MRRVGVGVVRHGGASKGGLINTYTCSGVRAQVALTIGSALDIFGGALSYRDVVEWTKRNAYL